MAVQHMRIVLSAYLTNGQVNDAAEYLRGLGVSTGPYSVAPQPSPKAAVNLEIGNIEAAEFAEHGDEQWNHFEAAVGQCLSRFGEWLATVPTQNMDRLREAGWKVWSIANLWIDQDQMDFHLPPVLSAQLGRLELELYVLSNE